MEFIKTGMRCDVIIISFSHYYQIMTPFPLPIMEFKLPAIMESNVIPKYQTQHETLTFPSLYNIVTKASTTYPILNSNCNLDIELVNISCPMCN